MNEEPSNMLRLIRSLLCIRHKSFFHKELSYVSKIQHPTNNYNDGSFLEDDNDEDLILSMSIISNIKLSFILPVSGNSVFGTNGGVAQSASV